jgi:FemAB-related protein (PEP-CTERM system-associated)
MSAGATITVSLCRDQVAWDTYVTSRPDAAGYHEWAWRGIFERAFGHECLYLTAQRSAAEPNSPVPQFPSSPVSIVGILPLVLIRSLLFGRTLTSLPFVNFGGVLADSDEVARALVDEAARLARERGCRHLELRHIGRRFPAMPCKQHKVTMRLPLQAGMWERIDRKARNQVRKAQKSALTVVRGGVELLPEFYRVFARNMRDLGTPVYSKRFFGEVMAVFPGRSHLIVVRLKGAPVAAGLTYRTGNMIEIPWASSIRDFNSLCPNHLVYWHAVETATAEGVAVFDFGRSTPNEGTFKFKEQWGAEPLALHWEYWLANAGEVPDQNPSNPKFKLAIETWKRLPLWIANAVGPRVVRDIP